MKIRPAWLIALALFVVTVLLYVRAASLPFCIIDDADYVSENVHVLGGLSFHSLKWSLTAFHAGNWHPLTWLSLMLDAQFFGKHPAGYHLVNVGLHALNASLLFLLFRSMTGALWRSAFVAACFALHPLHVESVAWIAERKDVLSSLFLILTLIFYAGYQRQSRAGYYLLSLSAFSLGLMAKAMLVTIPVLLIVLDVWPFRRLQVPFWRGADTAGDGPQAPGDGVGWKRIVAEKIPFLLISMASSVVTLYAQRQNLSNLTGLPVYFRVTNALCATVAYIEKMFLPVGLGVFYPLFGVPLWKAALAALFLCAVLYLAAKYRQSHPYLLAGWLWYLITLLPVIGIIQVGRQSMADRYTYIPLIGLFTVVSWGGAELCAQFPSWKKAVQLAAAGSLLALAVGTWVQLGYWRDNIALLTHTLQVTDYNSFAHDSLGVAYDVKGQTELAIEHYHRSLEIEPDNPEAHFNLAFLLDAHGRIDEAIPHYEEAIRLNPRLAAAHFSLGIIREKTEKLDQAESEYAEAIGIDPMNPKFHNNLGTLYARHGMLEPAIAQFSLALQADPKDRKAGENLQTALRQKEAGGGAPAPQPR